MLFLLLLIVLVISITFGNMLQLEGFITFGQNNTIMDNMQIPQYSSSYVHKLYDNIFYDPKNGNLIEVDGIGGNTVTGNTVSTLYVTPRTNPGITSMYEVSNTPNNTINLSTSTNTISSFNSWLYPTQCKNTDNYSVLYIPYGTDTLLHIIDNTNNRNIGTFGYISGATSDKELYTTTSDIQLGNYASDNDLNNDKLVNESYYDAVNNVYQISKYVKYDISNANVLIQTSSNPKSIDVYGRYGTYATVTNAGSYSASKRGISDVSFKSWITTDTLGNQLVVYICFGNKTVIALIRRDNSTGKYVLANVKRFANNGVYDSKGLLITTNALLSGMSGATDLGPSSCPNSSTSGSQSNMVSGNNSSTNPTTVATQLVLNNLSTTLGSIDISNNPTAALAAISNVINQATQTGGAAATSPLVTKLTNALMSADMKNNPTAALSAITAIMQEQTQQLQNQSVSGMTQPQGISNITTSGITNLPADKNALSEYFKWYWYWKANPSPNNEYSQDFVLKTSVVPPVCPSCPSCNQNSGICTNCGGQGGSGTISTTGNTIIKTDTRTNIPGAISSLGNTAGGIANKALDTTENIVDDAGNLIKGAVTGTVGLAKDTVTGTVGLAKDTVSGAAGLLRDAGSGVKDVLTARPTQINGKQTETQSYGSSSYGGSGATNYNYYGALPSKSSNFIPITTDFSSFGK